MDKYDFGYMIEKGSTSAWARDCIPAGSRVLEFGPSTGYLTKALHEKDCSVDIVELDIDAGSKAAQFAERALLGPEQGDIEHYVWLKAFELHTYDAIVFLDVLEHLHDPERVLGEAKNMLANDGRIYLSVPNIAHNAILINLFNNKWDYTRLGLLDDTHIHFFAYHSILALFKKLCLNVKIQNAIQKAVGDTEISNAYTDVPMELAQILKERTYADVYQMLFVLNADTNEPKTPPPLHVISLPATANSVEFYFEYPNLSFSQETLHKIYYPDNIFENQLEIPQLNGFFPQRMMISFPVHNAIVKNLCLRDVDGTKLSNWITSGLKLDNGELLFYGDCNQLLLELPNNTKVLYINWEIVASNARLIDSMRLYLLSDQEKIDSMRANLNEMRSRNETLDVLFKQEMCKTAELSAAISKEHELRRQLEEKLDCTQRKLEEAHKLLDSIRSGKLWAFYSKLNRLPKVRK